MTIERNTLLPGDCSSFALDIFGDVTSSLIGLTGSNIEELFIYVAVVVVVFERCVWLEEDSVVADVLLIEFIVVVVLVSMEESVDWRVVEMSSLVSILGSSVFLSAGNCFSTTASFELSILLSVLLGIVVVERELVVNVVDVCLLFGLWSSFSDNVLGVRRVSAALCIFWPGDIEAVDKGEDKETGIVEEMVDEDSVAVDVTTTFRRLR